MAFTLTNDTFVPIQLALDGRSLSGLPNCAIFWKTLTTVLTNYFLTTCKH